MNFFEFEVSPEQELELRNQPKLVYICQFMGIFKNVLRLNLNRTMTFGQPALESPSAANGNEYERQYGSVTAPISSKSTTVTPQDLEQSILRPQFDPLVGELVSRLLMKNKWKLKAGEATHEKQKDDEDNGPSLNYEQWNENLAKKFNVMYKSYKKFQQRFMKDDATNQEDVV